MKYLTALIALVMVSATAVKVTQPTPLPYPAVGVLLKSGWSMCTLTLIDERVVLTAAHCVDVPGNYTVMFHFDQYQVTDITIHPDYDVDAMIGDIALLTLETAPNITPIPISRTPVSIDDMFTKVVIVSRAFPKLRWKRLWIIGMLKGTDMVIWPDTNKWITSGDSGGPVIWDGCVGAINHGFIWDKNDKNLWQLGISTDVGLFTEWIDDYLRESDS